MAAPPAVESSAEPEALAGRLADGIELATTRGPREFRIVVRPPELGRLDVRVVETSEGLRVAIEASSRELRELLQQQLPQLRVALEGRELRIERLDVQQADPGTEWTDPRDEPRGRGRAGEQAQNQQTASFGGADDAADEGSETPPSSDGGQHVDVRA